MTHIPLHPTRGVNTHLTMCSRCGCDMDELILLGANEHIMKCDRCGVRSIGGRPKGDVCPECEQRTTWHRDGTVGEHDRLPASQLCEACKLELDNMRAIVTAGGIYWRCSDCGANGAISPEAGMSSAVRRQMGIEPPDPCGVEFSRDDCPACTGLIPCGDN